jgi:hypothetical protein
MSTKEETISILSECKKYKINNFKRASTTPTHLYSIGACLSTIAATKELLALNCLDYLDGKYKGIFKADTTERLTGKGPSTNDVLEKVLDYVINKDEEFFNKPYRRIIQSAIILNYPCEK